METHHDRAVNNAAAILMEAKARARVAGPLDRARLTRLTDAERARRYRARKRGEAVAERKPGPPPRDATVLRGEVARLEVRLAEARLELAKLKRDHAELREMHAAALEELTALRASQTDPTVRDEMPAEHHG